MTHQDKIHEYWSKTELSRMMIASPNVSDLDLLFLIPNNKKRYMGLPLTRISGKQKRKRKSRRKRQIYLFKMYDTFEELLDNIIVKEFGSGNFITGFVDIKDVTLGDKVIYNAEV